MEYGFYTLQDFFFHTKSVTYILMVVALLSIAGFWRFLSDKDED